MSLQPTVSAPEIRALLEQYFFAVDARDEALLQACFAADATGHYHRGFATEVVLEGAAAIARFLLQRVSMYSHTTHAIANFRVTAAGSGARSVMHAISTCVYTADSRILVRGLRYEDELVRGDDGWRIRHRLHVPQWQYDVAAVPPAIPQPRQEHRT